MTDLSFVEEETLREWLVSQRWFGSKSRDVSHIDIAEVVPLRAEAPLLDGGRDEIELMHAIMFSLPGTPVLYYGDEIMMGDNVYLGDRDGVRTPMQWTGDRNGGFSRADFAQLYAPPLMDPVYGFQAINVEAQLRTPTSILRWLRRFISLRKEHPVFGLGTYEPIEPSNEKIFAHKIGRASCRERV